MNKIIYIGLLATLLCFMTSCEKDNEATEAETSIEQTQLTLRVNNKNVLNTDIKGIFCLDTIDNSNFLVAGVSNTGYYFSEFAEFDNFSLELNQFIFAYATFEIDGEIKTDEFFISYVDLEDGQGPIYIGAGFELSDQETNFKLKDLGENKLSGTFEGTIYKIGDIDFDTTVSNILENQTEIGHYQLSFETEDIEDCE